FGDKIIDGARAAYLFQQNNLLSQTGDFQPAGQPAEAFRRRRPGLFHGLVQRRQQAWARHDVAARQRYLEFGLYQPIWRF
ncbi:MAG: hypothetical protein U9Q38_09070, partial [Thermodesulfobacteriota bacterium]|nr:hypothetical protein [Thermodesulfobacteriota bacterium]